jgi:hypothetical protein
VLLARRARMDSIVSNFGCAPSVSDSSRAALMAVATVGMLVHRRRWSAHGERAWGEGFITGLSPQLR